MSEAELVLKKLKQVTAICTVFIVLEVLGGVLAHSIAIISDALHLFSDVIAFVLSAFAVWLSTQTPPVWLAFGYHKIQPLGAFLNVIIIYIVTIYLFVEATERIINQEKVENPLYMLITAVFGLGCNLVMMKILHSGDTPGHECCGHDHGHAPKRTRRESDDDLHRGTGGSPSQIYVGDHKHESIAMDESVEQPSFGVIHIHSEACSHNHDHSDDHTHDHNKNDHHHQKENVESSEKRKSADIHDNLNIQAAYVHILGDIILSVGVALAALIIFFCADPDAPYSLVHLADPLCTYFFSVLVLVVTIPVLKRSVVVLLDGSLEASLTFEVKKELESLCVQGYSDLRIWSVSAKEHLGSFRVTGDIDKQKLQQLKKVFQQKNIRLFLEV